MTTHTFMPEDEARLYCTCGLPRRHPLHATKHPDPRAHARRTDPATSHMAAATVTDLTASQMLVLHVLRLIGPSTDERLAEHWATHDVSPISPSGLRTRRAELAAAGLVRDTGRLELTDAGRSSIVWEAVPDAAP